METAYYHYPGDKTWTMLGYGVLTSVMLIKSDTKSINLVIPILNDGIQNIYNSNLNKLIEKYFPKHSKFMLQMFMYS